MQRILSHMRKAIEEYNMIEENDKIAICLSGGKDSITMLYAFKALQRFYPKKFDLIAISIDPGFEFFNTDLLQKHCDEVGIPLFIGKSNAKEIVFDIRKEKNPCSLCANLRRGIINSIAIEQGCNKIALGHNEDDVLEEITEYKIDDTNILGKGSFGVVYKGTQKKGNKSNPVALKEIPKEIVDDKEKIQALADEIYISSILNEEEKGKNNSSIEGRENIASFLDIAEIDGKKYLAYEFCNGGDLKRYLKYFKKFDENMVQYIMRQVIRGIYHLHKRKIIHHDIKPENILIELFPDDKKDKKDKEDKEHKEDKKDKEDKEDKEHKEEIIKKVMMVTDIKNKKVYKDKSIMSDEELKEILLKSRMKVSDFGLSKFKEEGNNLVEVSGSPLYIEPNLFDNNVDPLTVESEKVDIWALGVLAYELYFYDLPFQPFPPSIERLKKSYEKGEYVIDFKKNKKVSKQFIRFLNICRRTIQMFGIIRLE